MKLLIDEDLSPQLAIWCAERKGIYAAAVLHLGLSGQSDYSLWQYAFENEFVVVTANPRDFIELLDVDLHPGLIVLREGNLSRAEQWERLEIAMDRILQNPDPANYMINRVVEVVSRRRRAATWSWRATIASIAGWAALRRSTWFAVTTHQCAILLTPWFYSRIPTCAFRAVP